MKLKLNLRHLSWDHFRLRTLAPQPHTLHLLRSLYPSVNWSRVRFIQGLPWYTPMVAPYVTAQALPDFYSCSRWKVYVRNWDEDDPACMADIIHEGYHITQAMQYWNGYGIGFFRGLMIVYNALFLQHGYRQNPFEVPAYEQEHAVHQACRKHGITRIPEGYRILAAEPALRHPRVSLPTAPWYTLVPATVLCALITVLRPAADLLAGAIALVRKRRSSGLQ